MHELRALVVDDSKVGRVTMLRKLEAMGLKVDLAESGQIALDYLAQRQPDVIFMDHMMPDMDGFEATRRIKAAPATRDIPVIIVSGNDEAGFIGEARAAGAIDAIGKPPTNEALEALLTSLPARSTAAVTAPAPRPVTVAPVPAASLDMAEVQALLARLVAEGVAPLREEVMAEVSRRLAAESASQRKTQEESAVRLDLQAAAMTDLQRGVAAAETLSNRLQTLEQRLRLLETEAARPQPDLAALRAEMAQHVDQRIAGGLAESQARSEALAPQLQNLRHDFQELRTRLNERAALDEQMGALSDRRLNTFTEDLERISRDVQALAAARTELGELRQRLSEPRLRELVAESLNQFQPRVAAQAAAEELAAPPAVGVNPQSEIAELRARLKTLTTLTAIGGALLLAAIGGLLIWG